MFAFPRSSTPLWLPALLIIGCASPQPPAPTAPAPADADPPPADATTDDDVAPMPPAHSPLSTDALAAIVAAPDRTDADRHDDERRRPVEMLAFLGVFEGMRVADIGAGTGYTTEMLARAVGPRGEVIGHNTPFVLDRFAEKGWSARLEKPELANVTRVDRPFDDPFGPEITGLDAAINVLFYHDFEWQGIDRAAHNRAVFNALRPGGSYVIIDAHAALGTGVSGSKTLHRIERTVVVDELTAAGFVLADEGAFLRNEHDTRDWNATPWSGDRDEWSDKFALRFERPE